MGSTSPLTAEDAEGAEVGAERRKEKSAKPMVSPMDGHPMRLRDAPALANRVSGAVLDAALKVHTRLGPGLLENAYKLCLAHELGLRGLRVEREVPLAVEYEGLRVEGAYFADLIVEGVVVVEAKAVEALHANHAAQLLTYLRLANAPVGILLNFHALRLMDGGFRRFALRAAAGGRLLESPRHLRDPPRPPR